MPEKIRMAVVTSHPLQYQAPRWRALAATDELSVEVLYAADEGAKPYLDKQLGAKIAWDTPLLTGYAWRVLENRPLRWLNWRFAYRCPGLAEALTPANYDLALLVGKEFWYYLQAFRLARKGGIPVLYRAESHPPKGTKLAEMIAAWHRRRVYRDVAAFLCAGARQREYYRACGIPESRLFQAPYCVDNAFFRAEREKWLPLRMETRARYGFDPACGIAAFVGKFIDKKRPLDAIRAVEIASRSFPAGLIMAGSGALLGTCQDYVRKAGMKNVAFAGFRNQTEIGAIYAAADCLVLPSDSAETWGLVVNEAMNFRLPVITSDQAGCASDLVEPGGNGYVFPMGDVAALARCIEQTLADEARRRAMGERSEQIVARYSIEENVRGILQAARAALRGRNA